MVIHELNTKALTSPAYIALDDGEDTYKVDFSIIKSALDGQISSIEEAAETAEETATAKTRIFYGELASTGSAVACADFAPTINGYDFIVVKSATARTAGTFTVGNYPQGGVYANGGRRNIHFAAGECLLFRVVDVTQFEPQPVVQYHYIGKIYPEATTSESGLMSAEDKAALDQATEDISDLKSEINEFVKKYKGAIPMTYTINSNRVSILSAFYTVTNNIVHRVILLRITTSAITSANTWTLGNITSPTAFLAPVADYITYTATSLSGGDISAMTFKQGTGSSGNFQLVTTAGIAEGQGGLIMLTHDQAITSATVTPFEDTEYPQELLNKTLLSENLFDASLTYSGRGWHVADAQLKSLSGYSIIQCRVQGGTSIKVRGLSEALSSFGYAIRDISGAVVASGGESNGMIIDVPDDGYLLIFTYPNSDTISLIPYLKKQVIVLGDSWSDNDPSHTTYTKWTTLLQQDGRYKVKVYAQNGSSISGDTPNYGLNGNVAGQMEQLKSDNILNVDYVIIFGGINDFRGTISNPYVYNKVAEFYATLNQMYPNARIIYISNNQVFITQQQLDYFHGIVDYLRTVVGMEAYMTFGWVHPSHYLSDYVHVDDNGYKDLYANIISILNGGCIETVKTVAQLSDGVTGSQIYESWVNGYPEYAIKTTVSAAQLSGTTEYNITADQKLLLASVPFAKKLNKMYPTSATMPNGMAKCDIPETFTTTSRLNLENTFVIYHASANSGTYITDNYN